MLSPTDWLLLAAVCAAGAMTPGISLAVISRHALLGGRRAGIAAALSHALGIGVWALATVTGISLLLHHYPLLETGLALAGALFLLWLARKSWRAADREPPAQRPPSTTVTRSAARDGFSIAFLNPKAGLFFLALFSQFLQADMTALARGQMVATALLIDGGWYLLVVSLLGRSRLPGWMRDHQARVERASAVLLALVAATVLLGLLLSAA